MDLKLIAQKLARISDLRRHLMNLTDAFESGTEATKPALAQTIGICVIELRVEMDEYLLLIESPRLSEIVDGHEIRVVQ
ncbi:MAG: hypothetical protein G3I10_03120 [Ferrovum sp.]|nr:hypothetical protein [Ferrovum sp.]